MKNCSVLEQSDSIRAIRMSLIQSRIHFDGRSENLAEWLYLSGGKKLTLKFYPSGT